MSKDMQRLKEITQRKVELRKEIAEGKASDERLAEIRKEAETLSSEEVEIRSRIELMNSLESKPIAGGSNPGASAADNFRMTNRMIIPMFKENRALLVSSGKLATPTAVATEIGELPQVISTIADDVQVIDATGTGSWKFPYKTGDASAVDVVEGEEIGGTGATFDFVEIGPGEWGVLDEVSNQVSKMSNVAYASAVQNSAYLALRKVTKEKVTKAILASPLAEKIGGLTIDQDYLRTLALGYSGDETVLGSAKLYLCKSDLLKLGKIRGTDKKALYEIKFTDTNNGTITEGGLVVPFSLNSTLEEGKQLYGQPQTVKLMLWGDYEVKTDEGGGYFRRNMLGIRGLATAGTDLTVKNGMQIITQAATPQEPDSKGDETP